MEEKEKKKTKFGIIDHKGKATITHEIDLSEIESPDPIAYAYGLVHGERGEPLSKDKDLASEFIRGWKEGHKRYKEKLKKEVV